MTKRISIKVLSVLMVLVFAVSFVQEGIIKPFTVSAETYGDLTYEIEDGEITITDCDFEAKSVKIPAKIDKYPVTQIGDGAFSECNNLTSVTIPNGVTSIGEESFSGCSNLTSVKIPNSVDSIGDNAFEKCLKLTSIKIPNSIYSISFGVFSDCTSLASVEIPNIVTLIDEYAFSRCESLASIEIPDNVTSIGEGAFQGCKNLTYIKIPDGITLIENNVFNSTGLKSVTIPSGVTSIGDSSFYHCTNLTTVSIPNSVVLIDLTAFVKCENLRAVTISNSNTRFAEIEDTEFVVFVGDRPFENCPNLTIYGEKGSHIEEYAEENNIPFSPLSSFAKNLVKGKTYKVNAFSGSANIAWSTSDSKVATVSKDGKVKCVAKGTCYIYAFDGKTVKSFIITVT